MEKLSEVESSEVRHGLAKMQKEIVKAVSLTEELEVPSVSGFLESLEAGRAALVAACNPSFGATVALNQEEVAVARVAVRLRHGDLVRVHKVVTNAEVEPGEELLEQIETCEVLGRRLGVQLDMLAES